MVIPVVWCLTDLQVKTIIGLGSKKQGTHGVHGSPLGPEDLKHVKAHYGFNPGKFKQNNTGGEVLTLPL